MKSAAALQAAIVLLLVASAASCEVAKEYSTRVFKPGVSQGSSDSTTALRFMQFDSGNPSDTIDLKEFFTKNAKQSDEAQASGDTTKTETVIIENRIVPREPPTEATKRGTTRSKRVRQ
ncbi:MAG TPA: hypothetical protein VFP97_16760 [Chitinophagaceae bacterium]|nr:hypothetical protein [Chitinophagaceae bacterium]